jgi:2-(1,2-epoxy-1,2-dihydrophenyl)acetyl-CoA isomerase
LRWKQQIPLLIRRCPKVVIAMLNGVAVGAGLGIAMSCDLRIASSTARFGTAFAKIGFAGDFGGTWTLTQLVGTARARQLYLSADMFDSAQALDWGIVSQVVEQEDLESTVMAEANRFANGPRVAYAYMKLNLNAAETESFSSVLDLEVVHQIRTSMTEDHQEASRAFVDKRLPIFKGR